MRTLHKGGISAQPFGTSAALNVESVALDKEPVVGRVDFQVNGTRLVTRLAALKVDSIFPRVTLDSSSRFGIKVEGWVAIIRAHFEAAVDVRTRGACNGSRKG